MNLMAIMVGFTVALGLSGLVGAIFGVALLSDNRSSDAPDPKRAFEAQLHNPALLVQLSLLSLVVAVISGAVTARMATAAPLTNAAIVGGIGTALGLGLPAPGFPRWPRLALAILTLPATLAGAWAIGLAG